MEIKRSRYDKLDLTIEIKDLQAKFRETSQTVGQSISQFTNDLDSVLNETRKLRQAFEIQNALELQDDLDKERIGIYGVLPNQNEDAGFSSKGIKVPGAGKLNLSLNTNCLSCSGQMTVS